VSEPIFARTAHHYDSYTDYWRLVELSGFASVEVGEIDADNPDATYIVTPVNGEWQAGWKDPKATIIAWILEWYDAAPEIPGVSQYWTSDRWYASEINARWVPFGSHPDLVHARHDPINARWDVALLAYMAPARRSAVREQLEEAGLSIAPMGWGETRDDVLEHSRVLVHVHQHDNYPGLAVQRFAFAAAARIPIISERINDPAPLHPGEHYLSFEYGQLAEGVAATLSGGIPLVRMADQMTRCLCYEHDFRSCVLKAVGHA